VQLLHHLGRGTARRADAEGRVLHDVDAQLLERRRVGELLQARLAPGVEHAQLAGLHLRREAGGVGRGHQVAAEQRLHQVGAALVGHVLQFDARLLRDAFGGQVRTGQGAGGAVGQLAGVGLGVGDEVGPGLERAVAGHHDAEGVAGHVQDIADVLDRVPVDLGGVADAKHPQRGLRDGVAVRLRGLQLLHGQRAASARLVFHDHRLAQDLAGVLGELAHGDVRRAASREGDHQLDGLGREGLRMAGQRQQRAEQGGGERGTSEHGASPVCVRKNVH